MLTHVNVFQQSQGGSMELEHGMFLPLKFH
jgi:hypothetical protein